MDIDTGVSSPFMVVCNIPDEPDKPDISDVIEFGQGKHEAHFADRYSPVNTSAISQ